MKNINLGDKFLLLFNFYVRSSFSKIAHFKNHVAKFWFFPCLPTLTKNAKKNQCNFCDPWRLWNLFIKIRRPDEKFTGMAGVCWFGALLQTHQVWLLEFHVIWRNIWRSIFDGVEKLGYYENFLSKIVDLMKNLLAWLAFVGLALCYKHIKYGCLSSIWA